VQIHSRLYFTGKIQLMTADTVSPIKPIYRLDPSKHPFSFTQNKGRLKLFRRPLLNLGCP
ncbi:hypothetical protein ACTHUD_18825, partial [Neisseria sp. P0016.S002]